MKYFYIKCTQTYKCKFSGTVVEYIFGKGQNMVAKRVLKSTGGYINHVPEFDNTHIRYYADQYAYSKKHTAESVIKKAKRDTVDPVADCVCEVIEVDID